MPSRRRAAVLVGRSGFDDCECGHADQVALHGDVARICRCEGGCAEAGSNASGDATTGPIATGSTQRADATAPSSPLYEVEPPETPVRFNPPPLPSDARDRVAHPARPPADQLRVAIAITRKHSAGRSCKLQGPISKHIQGNGTRSRKGVTFNQRYRQISIEVTPADLEFLNRNKGIRFLA
jgi:hypothetical protein